MAMYLTIFAMYRPIILKINPEKYMSFITKYREVNNFQERKNSASVFRVLFDLFFCLNGLDCFLFESKGN